MLKLTDKQLKLYRIIDIVGLIFVSIGFFNNIVDGVDQVPFTHSILYPYTNFLVPGTNLFTLILCIVYLFTPTQVWIIFFLFIIQTVNLILTGYTDIGIVLYVNCIAIGFCTGFAKKHFRLKAAIFCSFLPLLLLTIVPFYAHEATWLKGWLVYLYYLGHTAFTVSCYFVLYQLLSDKLSFLLGDYKVPDLSPSINLPEKGGELDLKSLGLTDRQIACIEYTITTSYNYKQIADKLITSESTVKKDMQDMYKFFGVKNREMLRILLLQYTII